MKGTKNLVVLLSILPNKRIWRLLGFLVAIVIAFSIGVNHHIANAYNDRIYKDPRTIPANRVGLVLGTAKSVYGRPNLYYLARLDAARDVRHTGRILLDAGEFAARVKAALDVWVLGTDPKFLGEPVVIARVGEKGG